MLACPCASMCPALGWSCVWQCVLLHRHWLVATLPFLFARDTISLASLCCLERSLVTKSLIKVILSGCSPEGQGIGPENWAVINYRHFSRLIPLMESHMERQQNLRLPQHLKNLSAMFQSGKPERCAEAAEPNSSMGQSRWQR